MKNKKMIFFLGGYDLEMITIKELLEQNDIKFIDKNLSWGAKLSDYQDELENYKDYTIYGIELELDIEVPNNYIEIDHHNKNSNKNSSLEQVAQIINIELNRFQKLVSENDSAYIKGMKKLYATKDEIKDIRAKDRKAQGITKKDEDLAIKSLENNTTNIIYSQTSHFTTISDKIYDKFDEYIIYNDNKIVFYNYEVSKILDILKQNNLKETDYYFGGGEFGFIGIKDNILNKEQIKNLIKEFNIEEENKKEIISYHTFMLPFTFDGDFKKTKNWTYKQFNIKDQKDYNEYVYFYKHVQDALYNTKDEKEKFISKYYEYKDQKGTYTISSKKGDFILELDGISLRIFNTNIAILSFNLINTKYKNNSDILAINDFGRRIYPTFLGNNFTFETKQSLLACNISLCFENQDPISDDFSRFDKKENLSRLKDNLLPKYITNLIENNFKNENKPLRPIIDDRMFVISQYNNDDCINRLKKYDESNGYIYENDDFWYEYIFVDGDGKTCQSKYMTKEFIKNSTYDRWIEWGTLFGISRYSFVAVTGSWYGKEILLPHTQTMYFQIFSLLLAYRASIIKFSDDIQNVTNTSKNEISNETQKLYKKYLNFLNKLYFKEVTAQDQGIELYNQAIKIMDIDKYIKDLDNEINELHNYIDMLEEKQRNDNLEFISNIGAILLPPSFMTGLFGMNILTFSNSWWNETFGLFLIILSGLLGYSFVDNKDNKSILTKFSTLFKKFRTYLIFLFIGTIFIFSIFSDPVDNNTKGIKQIKISKDIHE